MDKKKTSDLPRYLSAKYKDDFAYPTVKDRLPVILTKIVDKVYRSKSQIDSSNQDVLDDLKSIAGALSQMKYEMQTDKPLTEIQDEGLDAELWNTFIKEYQAEQDKEGVEETNGVTSQNGSDLEQKKPSWFSSHWLYVECYFYRKIAEAFKKSSHQKAFDPFWDQKTSSFHDSNSAILTLATAFQHQLETKTQGTKDYFIHMLKISLWGNKCDLSISGGADNAQTEDPLEMVDRLNDKLLVDEVDKIWSVLNQDPHGTGKVDIILDNSGFELFTDLCIAELLISNKIVERICFHAKKIPWFVSDVTEEDFAWTLGQLAASKEKPLAALGKKWQHRVANSQWMLRDDYFWTLPQEFCHLKEIAPDLHKDLTESKLLIFKGDLNYRKLFADRKWLSTTNTREALQGFLPAPLCTLRTLKSDIVVGLESGQAEKTKEISKDWMISGEFGVIQCVS